MGDLRTPFFILGLIALILATLTEAGPLLGGGPPLDRQALTAAVREQLREEDPEAGESEVKATVDDLIEARRDNEPAPGLGVPSLALLDLLVCVTVLLMGLALLLPGRIHGRIQGVIMFITGILVALAAIALIFGSFILLMTMVSLFLAIPFGTLAYLAIWGFFDTGTASVLLSLSMFLKIAFAVLLVIAQQRFIQNKGLVLIILTTLIATFVVSFLHGFPPGILVSITDALGAIIVGILTLIWAVVLALGSIWPIIKAIRVAPSQE
jgi:hypothetical protein